MELSDKARHDISNAVKVVIVGGGSAGWMTAAYLSKVLERGVSISLVEAPTIGSIGVGEASFSTIQLFFNRLGLQEEDWMSHCNASYKAAIKFVDWNADKQQFYHPFQQASVVNGRSLLEWWRQKANTRRAFDYDCLTVPRLCDTKRSPRFLDGNVFDRKVAEAGRREYLENQLPYAYHFDASLLAEFMMKYAEARGVVRKLAEVVDVSQDDNGNILALYTNQQEWINGDLFIDCTGFEGKLINKRLNEPFISFGDSLPCDRAVAMRIPHDAETAGLNPFTTATALSSGWVWDIPLFNRTGVGYVYSTAFVKPDAAEAELRRHLSSRADGCDAIHIKMRVGRNRRSWVKNCVAIGLASGFVEPLESTGIFFIQHGIEQLVNYFPSQQSQEAKKDAFNKAVNECMDGVREFLTLHYVANTRSDNPFWKATKHDLLVPAELKERMKLWKIQLPSNRTINPNYHGFEGYNYSVMLMGLGYVSEESPGVVSYMDDSCLPQVFEKLRSDGERLATELPSHFEYLINKYTKYRRQDKLLCGS